MSLGIESRDQIAPRGRTDAGLGNLKAAFAETVRRVQAESMGARDGDQRVQVAEATQSLMSDAQAGAAAKRAAPSYQPGLRPLPPTLPDGQVVRPNVPQWSAPVGGGAETSLASRALSLVGKAAGVAVKVAGFVGAYFSMTRPAGTPPMEGALSGGHSYRYTADEGSLSVRDGAGRHVASARQQADGTFRTENGETVARLDPSGKGLKFDVRYLAKLQSPPANLRSGRDAGDGQALPDTGSLPRQGRLPQQAAEAPTMLFPLGRCLDICETGKPSLMEDFCKAYTKRGTHNRERCWSAVLDLEAGDVQSCKNQCRAIHENWGR